MKTTTIFLLLLASAFQLPAQVDEFELEEQILKTDFCIVNFKTPISELCSLLKNKDSIQSLGIKILGGNHYLRKIRHELAPCFDVYKTTRFIRFLQNHPYKDLLELKRYPNLELLSINTDYYIMITKDKGGYLRRGLKGLDKLKIVKIKWILDVFPTSLYRQKKMVSLMIGFEDHSLSKPLDLPELVSLKMYAPNLKKFPDGITNSPYLKTITIMSNGFFHSLPNGIAKLKRLEELDANIDTGNMENINILNQIDRQRFELVSYLDHIDQISPNVQYLHSNIVWRFYIIRESNTPEVIEKCKVLKKLCPTIDIRFPRSIGPFDIEFMR